VAKVNIVPRERERERGRGRKGNKNKRMPPTESTVQSSRSNRTKGERERNNQKNHCKEVNFYSWILGNRD